MCKSHFLLSVSDQCRLIVYVTRLFYFLRLICHLTLRLPIVKVALITELLGDPKNFASIVLLLTVVSSTFKICQNKLKARAELK